MLQLCLLVVIFNYLACALLSLFWFDVNFWETFNACSRSPVGTLTRKKRWRVARVERQAPIILLFPRLSGAGPPPEVAGKVSATDSVGSRREAWLTRSSGRAVLGRSGNLPGDLS